MLSISQEHIITIYHTSVSLLSIIRVCFRKTIRIQELASWDNIKILLNVYINQFCHNSQRTIWKIAANSIQKTMAITFLKDGSRRIAMDRDGSRRIATDRIAESIPENNGDHFGGEI